MEKIFVFLLFVMSVSSASAQQVTVAKAPALAALYQRTDISANVSAPFSNPYDQRELAVDLVVLAPSGKTLRLPLFYVSGPSGNAQFQARFAPLETGTHRLYLALSAKGAAPVVSESFSLEVKSSRSKGFLHPYDRWTFRYSDGTPFRGIGENFSRGSHDEDDSKFFRALQEDTRFSYDRMLPKLAQNGVNFFRTWMIYWNLPVDWPTPQNNRRYQSSIAPYNESGLKRMDRLAELCDSLGIHVMLALESHVGFMGSGWEISPYNIKNGGAAATPFEFFDKPDARAQYKNKLRLMVPATVIVRRLAHENFSTK